MQVEYIFVGITINILTIRGKPGRIQNSKNEESIVLENITKHEHNQMTQHNIVQSRNCKKAKIVCIDKYI